MPFQGFTIKWVIIIDLFIIVGIGFSLVISWVSIDLNFNCAYLYIICIIYNIQEYYEYYEYYEKLVYLIQLLQDDE